MWVFGYGSLMWDDWEKPLEGLRVDHAVLLGFHRSFNKKSVKNWGTPDAPGPTLGLEPTKGGTCIGSLFNFPDSYREKILSLLKGREGPSFALLELPVSLPSGQQIIAVTPVNDRSKNTYIGRLPLGKRAAMAKKAKGDDGACADYVRNIHQKLVSLGIVDPDVEDFLKLIDSP